MRPDSFTAEFIRDLVRDGLSCRLQLVHWSPGFESKLMARVSRAGNQTICHAGIGLLFLWSSLAFLEAKPLTCEGVIPQEYQPDDGWSSLDFLRHLNWEGDRLSVELGVIRGRQVSTRFEVNQAGVFFVMTQGRGDSALNWFDAFRG
ncbi:MAG: hypothetical protein ACK5QT_00915 [Oligoflexia bacterium]